MLLAEVADDPEMFKRIIRGDETWVYGNGIVKREFIVLYSIIILYRSPRHDRECSDLFFCIFILFYSDRCHAIVKVTFKLLERKKIIIG